MIHAPVARFFCLLRIINKSDFFSCTGDVFFSRMKYKREEDMGKIRRFLGFFALLFVALFVGDAWSAGYTCPEYKRYTSCNSGYYLNNANAGNSCLACSAARNTTSVQSCTRSCSIANGTCSYSGSTQKCTGNFTGGGGDSTVGTGKCTGCSSWGTCSGGTMSISCNAKYELLSGACSACGTGEYSAKGDNACKACTNKPANSYYTGNASSNTCAWACNTGYHKNSAGTACEPNTIRVTCSAGQYIKQGATSCSSCPANSYCAGGSFTIPYTGASTNQGITGTCVPGYSSTAGSDTVSDCKITCSAGTIVATVNARCTTPSGNWYSSRHVVSQGSTSGTNKKFCDSGYSITGTSAANHDSASDCTRSCQICCTNPGQSACPANSTSCTFDTSVCNPGTQSQGSSNCVGRAAGQCPVNGVTCKSGYNKSGLTCVAATYTVTYKNGGGTGADQTQSVTYNASFTTKPATIFTRPGYNFTSWGGSYPNANSSYRYTTAGNTTLTAQWSACANNPTTGQGTCNCGGNAYPNGQGCSNCSVSCRNVPKFTLGTYNVCESETDNECYRNCTTSDVANSTVVSGTVTKGGTRSCKATSCAEDYYLSGNGCAACVPNATCPGGGETFECNAGYHLSDDGRSCEPDEYIITLKKNGGSGTVNGSTGTNDATQTCKHGQLCNLPTSGLTRTGFAFTGWGTSSACTNGVYQKVFTGAETLYACWSQQTTQCQSGKYYNGTDHVDCPSGSYCPGTGSADIGQAGCASTCPVGYDGSDVGSSSATGCYQTCGAKSITNGTATVVDEKVYYTGSAYPACTYHVTCNAGYRATNQDTATATCTQCIDGQYCPGGDGTDVPELCPAGSYCPDGVKHECPGGGLSDAGSDELTDCYLECDATIPVANAVDGVAQSNGNAYHKGGSEDAGYKTCTYSVTCSDGYTAQNNNSAAPKCVWADPDACPENYYCPPDSPVPLECPDGGKSDGGATSVEQCYKEFIDYEKFLHGKADAQCYYQNITTQYDKCEIIGDVKSCDAGYYYRSGMECSGTQSGYYSPAGSITQTSCPNRASDDSVKSPEYAASYTQCTMACEIEIPHSSTVAAASPTVNAISADEYAPCSFSVTCNNGYTVQDNNTESPSCNANVYTITLDKNGGSSASVPGSVECTFDSQNCELPETSSLVRAGYTVGKQWCSDRNGGAPCYDAGTAITENISGTGQNTTLYAVWTPNVYTINLNHSDATVDGAPETVYLKYATDWFSNADATVDITNMTQIPEKSGYEFAGYFSMTSGGVQVIGANGAFQTNETALTFTTTNPTTVYARWGAGMVHCDAGTYYSGTGTACTECPANSYCPAGDYATDSGAAGAYLCPENGLSASKSESVTACYKTRLEYNAVHGDGTQTCNYDEGTRSYSAKCTDRVITMCDAGYYLADADAEVPDCGPVGTGYYSGGNTTERTACPNGGDTESDTSTTVQNCFKTNQLYTATYGSGTQTCMYSSGDDADAVYNRDCYDKKITACRGGYYLASDSDIDCTVVGIGYYSDPDDTARYQCPAGGTTTEENAAAITRCIKDGQPATTEHGAGERACYYTSGDGADAVYSNLCQSITMTSCDAGYYYDAAQTTSDCVPVGLDHYSPAVDMQRHECPLGGQTTGETSESASDCYRDDMECRVTNGSGVQTCNYDNAAQQYSADCQTCNVTACDTGYSQVGNECIMCPAGYVCTGGQQQKCSDLTDGEYPYSDTGTTDVAFCYANCDMADNAAAMTGRDYYTANDTCEIAQCTAGYTLDGGECAECPAGSFCDGGMPGDDAHACADLGDGDWEYSAPGATDESGCYQICEEYDITNGTAIPINEQAFYPNECEYRGESDTGNPCEIVDGVCVEISCKPEYEMKNGVCVPCARDYALTYETEGNCRVATCELGYHPNGDQCENNISPCNITNAIYAEQEWDFKRGAFGACIVKECDYGYHIASNACVTDTQPCVVENGTGYQEWDARAGKWGECVATYCEPGYTNDPSESNEPTKQCGECRNKYSVLGQQAVAASTYIQGCEIGACLYQGELYNLENNECVPICPMEEYEDETGTMIWDDSRKKCVRTCKEGYTMW